MDRTLVKVAIVEDDTALREMLTEVVGYDHGFEISGIYADGESFRENADFHRPDVVLMDINLPGASGIEVMAKVKLKYPDMLFIIITVYDDAGHLFDALRYGASGYMLKHTPPEGIATAIREVIAGGSPMSADIARMVVESFRADAAQQQAMAKLSVREQEITTLLAQGYRYKEIAAQLFLSVETVRTHIRNIYEKLQVNSRTEALGRLGKLR